MLDARLFAARGTERFGYAHRAIGEFLAAGWLARRADTSRKRRRLFALFHNQALVPANLRGIHAWLAWHSSNLTMRAIAADPMGVIEYGDVDQLNTVEARALLNALTALSRENPHFRDWAHYYRVRSLVQRELLPDIREVLRSPDTELGLKLLVLQALEGSPLAPELADVLFDMLKDRRAAFASRIEAGERLAAAGGGRDWPSIVSKLLAEEGDHGPRLAIELAGKIGLGAFDDKVLLAIALGQLGRSENHVGVYYLLQRALPIERIGAMLDGLSAAAAGRRARQGRVGNYELADLVYALVAKRLAYGPVNPARLWDWLEPFDGQVGIGREDRGEVARLLQANPNLRRAVQRYVLLDMPGEKTVWQRSWRLNEVSSGLTLTEHDAARLLADLDAADERWRDIVTSVQHALTKGSTVYEAASHFATGAADADWLARLTEPHVCTWEIEHQERARKREVEKQRRWSSHRAGLISRVDELRCGAFGAVINPAMAYLKLFSEMGDEASDGPGRLKEWLGSDLRDASLAGFEAFLNASPPHLTAADIAEGYAEGRRWNAAFIVVAALAERLRRGGRFDDLPDERLMAGLIEIWHTNIDHRAVAVGLKEALVVKSRPKLSPISRPNVTPLDRAEAMLDHVLSVVRGDGAVGKWPAGATVQSLAEAGHLSTAGAGRDRFEAAVSCGS